MIDLEKHPEVAELLERKKILLDEQREILNSINTEQQPSPDELLNYKSDMLLGLNPKPPAASLQDRKEKLKVIRDALDKINVLLRQAKAKAKRGLIASYGLDQRGASLRQAVADACANLFDRLEESASFSSETSSHELASPDTWPGNNPEFREVVAVYLMNLADAGAAVKVSEEILDASGRKPFQSDYDKRKKRWIAEQQKKNNLFSVDDFMRTGMHSLRARTLYEQQTRGARFELDVDEQGQLIDCRQVA